MRVHDDFSITIEFQDIFQQEIISGLYFDLLTWAKNVETELKSINGNIFINFHTGQNIQLRIQNNGIEEEYFFIRNERLTESIFLKLNEYFQTNGQYDNLDSIDLFVKNNANNIAIDQDFGLIFSDLLYLNADQLMENINEGDGYFIESIRVNRRNINNIIGVDSWLCG